jgi:hypothetical protein
MYIDIRIQLYVLTKNVKEKISGFYYVLLNNSMSLSYQLAMDYIK